MQKALFDGEEIVKTWNNCTLTNKRVWEYIEDGGKSQYRGFPLNQFQGAKVGRTSNPWLMYAGCFFCVISFLSIITEAGLGAFMSGLIFGGVLLLVWHFTKRAEVYFGSVEVGIRIFLHANDKDFEDAVSFVSEIEIASTRSNGKVLSVA